jgi:hypothetical protein
MKVSEKPKWLALAVVLIFLVGGMSLLIMQETGSAAIKTGQVSIGNRYTYVSGFNGSATQFAKVTATGNTLNITFTNFDPTYVVVATGNPTYDVHGLLNTSDIYQTTSIGTKSANSAIPTLQTAFSDVGKISNGTNMKIKASHMPVNVAIQQSLYTNTSNDLGTQQGYSVFSLFATPFHDYQSYVMTLNYTNASVNTSNSGHVYISFTNYLTGFGQNLIVEFEVGLFLSTLVGGAIMLYALPRRW